MHAFVVFSAAFRQVPHRIFIERIISFIQIMEASRNIRYPTGSMCALFNARFFIHFCVCGLQHVARTAERPHETMRPSGSMRGCRRAVPKRRARRHAGLFGIERGGRSVQGIGTRKGRRCAAAEYMRSTLA
ncbi:hypothetical protein KTD18_22890 [Burkholderia multivorans]|uniref:hypothetical protein n=1 Tax=Burkholderia multivorans TaxID=87883 RepID=UPI0011B25CEC|nr:hypothetical protein [Burkholderia multivorans]MBU9294393.1 hypothetical protein [Burkholderia multivorans]